MARHRYFLGQAIRRRTHQSSSTRSSSRWNVELVFEGRSLEAIAHKALMCGMGARALKSIIEEVLLNSMFEVPSRPDIKRCIISEESIVESREPEFVLVDEADRPEQLSMAAQGSRGDLRLVADAG